MTKIIGSLDMNKEETKEQLDNPESEKEVSFSDRSLRSWPQRKNDQGQRLLDEKKGLCCHRTEDSSFARRVHG